MSLTHGALFNGIGGFPLAAQWAGIETIWTCEIDEYCNEQSRKHYPKAKQYQNIETVSYPEPVDIISGGFPCQDISQVKTNGSEGIKGKRSGLWNHYARIVGEIRPKYIVFENSPKIVIRGLEYVLCDLAKIGYNAEWHNFYAKDWFFPDLRERVYGIAYAPGFGCFGSGEQGGILSKVVPTGYADTPDLSMPFERFNGKSNFGNVSLDNGFSKELDRRAIKAYGNAIKPQIAYDIFKAIKDHHSQILKSSKSQIA